MNEENQTNNIMQDQPMNTSKQAQKPEMSQQSTGSLGKFAIVFMAGCLIFALFLIFAGKAPFFPSKNKLIPNVQSTKQRANTTEPSTEQVIKQDQSKDESTVTNEVMNEIDDLNSTDVTTNYSGNQLDDLK